MFTNLYEHEVTTKNTYDGLREYCVIEKVNEEYLRGSIRKKREHFSMKRKAAILAAFPLT